MPTSTVLFSCSNCAEGGRTRAHVLDELYYCTACPATTAGGQVRCAACVVSETDSFFCPACLENMPSAEATQNRGRCTKCFDCPSCRATLATVRTGEGERVLLRCMHCRWSSDAVGLCEDSPEKLYERVRDSERTSLAESEAKRLLKAASETAARAAKQREAEAKRSRRVFGTFKAGTAADGTSGPAAPVQGPEGVDAMLLAREADRAKPLGASKAAVAEEEVARAAGGDAAAALPTGVRPGPVDLVPSLAEQVAQMDIVRSREHLYPLRKPLIVKRAKRCNLCERYVLKPEISPQSTTFKVHNLARAFLPSVTLAYPGPYDVPCGQGQTTTLALLFSNALDEAASVTLAAAPGAHEADTFMIVDVPDAFCVELAAHDELAAIEAAAEAQAQGGARAAADAEPGVHARHLHTATVLVRVTPRPPPVETAGRPVQFSMRLGVTAGAMRADIVVSVQLAQ